MINAPAAGSSSRFSPGRRDAYFFAAFFVAAFWRFLRAFHFWRRIDFTRMCLLFEFAISPPGRKAGFYHTSAVRRHEALRTTFRYSEGRLCQVIAARLSAEIRLLDLQDVPMADREGRAQAVVNGEAQQDPSPFPL